MTNESILKLAKMRSKYIVVIVAGHPLNHVAVIWREHVAAPFTAEGLVLEHPDYLKNARFVRGEDIDSAIAKAYEQSV